MDGNGRKNLSLELSPFSFFSTNEEMFCSCKYVGNKFKLRPYYQVLGTEVLNNNKKKTLKICSQYLKSFRSLPRHSE